MNTKLPNTARSPHDPQDDQNRKYCTDPAAARVAQIPVFLVMLTALVLRLYQLGTESLWIDEGYSYGDAMSIGLTKSISGVRPLYFMFLSLWMQIGQSEFILRLPSALFGTAAVYMIYLLGRRMVSERTGLIAAALMAVSPLQVNYSQEIRMYSLVVLLVTAAVYQFLRYIEARRVRHIGGYTALTVLGVATFPLTALMIPIMNLSVLRALSRETMRKWAAMQAIILLLCIPLIISAISDVDSLAPEQTGWPSLLQVMSLIGEFSLGHAPALLFTPKWYLFAAHTLGSLALIAFGVLMCRQRAVVRRWQLTALLCWFAVPVIITAGLVSVTGAQWLPRYVLYASPAYFLLIGIGVDVIRTKRMQYLAIACLLLLPAVKLPGYYKAPIHPQWKEAVALIEHHELPGDAVAVYRPGNGLVFEYYYRGDKHWEEVGLPKLQKARPWTDARAAGVIGDLPQRYERVWLVMSDHSPEAGKTIEEHIRKNYRLLREEHFVGIDILLFE